MLSIITEPQEITSCQELLNALLRVELQQTDYRNLKPGHITNIHTIYNDDIWFAHSHVNQRFQNSKKQNLYKNNGIERRKIIYWNGFGVSTNKEKIIVETNIVCYGRTKEYAGIFAKNSNNDKFLLHTGNISKNKEDLRNRYQEKYPEKWVKVGNQHNNQPESEYAILVTPLQEPKFLENIKFFIEIVADIKNR